MQQNDFERFAYCMKALQEEFTPKDEVSPMKMEINFKALSDLPIDSIEKATWHLINTRKTASFPKVAEIREAIFGNADEKAVVAYNVFTEGKAQTGAYQSVCFEDKLIHAVVQAMGGWYNVCMITEEEWKFRRKEFIDLYRAFSHRSVECPEKLIGLGEHGCNENPDWKKFMPKLYLISNNGKVVDVKPQLPEPEKVKQIG